MKQIFYLIGCCVLCFACQNEMQEESNESSDANTIQIQPKEFSEEDLDDNNRSNSRILEQQFPEVLTAFTHLESLFEIPDSYRIMDMYCEQIDSVEIYSSHIPKEVFFYYTIDKSDIYYCSKFLVDENNVELIFHKLTEQEEDEFSATAEIIDSTTDASIEALESLIESME